MSGKCIAVNSSDASRRSLAKFAASFFCNLLIKPEPNSRDLLVNNLVVRRGYLYFIQQGLAYKPAWMSHVGEGQMDALLCC